MACETPDAATRVGGIKEVVVNDETAQLAGVPRVVAGRGRGDGGVGREGPCPPREKGHGGSRLLPPASEGGGWGCTAPPPPPLHRAAPTRAGGVRARGGPPQLLCDGG